MGKKRSRGAQPGNLNRLRHGAYLNEAKRGARATRDQHRRAAEREGRQILKSAGLEGDPLARLVAKQLVRLETMAARLEAYLERRGYFKRDGSPAPAAVKLVDVVDRLLGEARRLMEDLRGQGGDAVTLEDLIRQSYDEDAGHIPKRRRQRSAARTDGESGQKTR